ncbi:hypothetical protein ACFO5R_21455 [Halosolutus amylolyticus]|uniref:DUF8119 domain-containing protein n=1 Tax=Halosolutus amylolyticus TaxID=2932267 RepID=A0ABD5PV82_9EURY|nr:hypothetical protein [Halosolutus amylolyticus]
MSNDRRRSSRGGAGRSIVSLGTRLFLDAVVVTLWVVFVTLVFLTTGWPQWAFYTALILGVGGYVQLTASWW